LDDEYSIRINKNSALIKLFSNPNIVKGSRELAKGSVWKKSMNVLREDEKRNLKYGDYIKEIY
jgi:hypothetical protein